MKALFPVLRKPRVDRGFLVPVLGISLLASSVFSQSYWPQFRGPTGHGISPTARPPTTLGKAEEVWSVEIPPGHSSPCVWGDRIFLTTFAEGKLECRAHDRSGGSLFGRGPFRPRRSNEPIPSAIQRRPRRRRMPSG